MMAKNCCTSLLAQQREEDWGGEDVHCDSEDASGGRATINYPRVVDDGVFSAAVMAMTAVQAKKAV